MADRCQLCYITDRNAFPGDESSRRRQLLAKTAEAARAGVDYIQLREKDLSTRDLESLAGEAAETIRRATPEVGDLKHATRLLINSRLDVALAVGADGVHLRSDDISVHEAHTVASDFFTRSSPIKGRSFLVGVSCHTPDEVRRSESDGADFAVFAPVFEKKDAPETPATGLEILREACWGKLPVFALGGVTMDNARACLNAGAAGIAAIRLFQENTLAEVVRQLRSR
jgi:thiamine-phosphate pyrophosphorylase